MKITVMLTVLLLLLGATPAWAHPIDDYLAMADKAMANPRDADYVALRKAYYAIVAARDDARRNKLADDIDQAKKLLDSALGKNNLDLAERYQREYLRLTFGSIVNQRAAAFFYEKRRNNPTRAAEHRWIADQMLDAIVKIGDGKSVATAYLATTVREEYLVMERLGLQSKGQALMHDKGRHYDLLRGVPVKNPSGAEIQVYFDISSFF
ncbi:MAG: hypothetical protein ABI439_12005 [Rhodospirillales bacterium]